MKRGPKKLKAYRLRNRMTQEELAQLLACSISMVSLLERGKRKPGFDLRIGIFTYTRIGYREW